MKYLAILLLLICKLHAIEPFTVELEWDFYEDHEQITGFIVEVDVGFGWQEEARVDEPLATTYRTRPLVRGLYKYRLKAYKHEDDYEPPADPFAPPPSLVQLLSPGVDITSEPSNEVDVPVMAITILRATDLKTWKPVVVGYCLEENAAQFKAEMQFAR